MDGTDDGDDLSPIRTDLHPSATHQRAHASTTTTTYTYIYIHPKKIIYMYRRHTYTAFTHTYIHSHPKKLK